MAEANQRARVAGGYAVLGKVASTPNLAEHGRNMPQPSERADRNRGQKDESNPRDDPQAKATNRLADFVTPTAKHHQAREQHSPNVQVRLSIGPNTSVLGF